MFDRDNPVHLTALRAEVFDNLKATSGRPAVDGLPAIDPLPATGDAHYEQDEKGTPLTASVLAGINIVENNRLPGTVARALDDVAIAEVAGIIDDAEYAGLSAYGRAWVNMLIANSAGTGVVPFKKKFLELFGNVSTTRANAIALLPIDGTRGELMFGYATRIIARDWQVARDSA